MMILNATHDAALLSWVSSANVVGADFPIQSLPYGVFCGSSGGMADRRVGVAIGNQILDVPAAIEAGVLRGVTPEAVQALGRGHHSLNAFMALGPEHWSSARAAISHLLASSRSSSEQTQLNRSVLIPMSHARLSLPVEIGDYTDFYASIHHATRVGSMFRPDQPLLPNYRHVPIGYHGRASSVVLSGTPIRRPWGQVKGPDDLLPTLKPSARLDYEMELGALVGGRTLLGESVPMSDVDRHLFGFLIVNDWSARDIQGWEYQPLGPFTAKNFGTTVSPWVVTAEALAPYRVTGPARSVDDPAPLPYLQSLSDWGLDLAVEVYLSSQKMREAGQEPVLISRGRFMDMYWTFAQMLVHHTVTGCNLNPGDLLASGTISGPADDSVGCLLERTMGGKTPFSLPDGTERRFLEDGDEVVMKAYAQREGAARISLGEARGMILPAQPR